MRSKKCSLSPVKAEGTQHLSPTSIGVYERGVNDLSGWCCTLWRMFKAREKRLLFFHRWLLLLGFCLEEKENLCEVTTYRCTFIDRDLSRTSSSHDCNKYSTTNTALWEIHRKKYTKKNTRNMHGAIGKHSTCNISNCSKLKLVVLTILTLW